jgi:hypothetical protein
MEASTRWVLLTFRKGAAVGIQSSHHGEGFHLASAISVEEPTRWGAWLGSKRNRGRRETQIGKATRVRRKPL